MNHNTGIALALAHNLQRLMTHFALSQAQLSKNTGIGQSTLSNLLDTKKPLEINPRASTIDQLSQYFKIPAWQLLVPDLPLELLTTPRLAHLIENYRDAPEIGRSSVDRIAESEVRYGMASDLKKAN